MIHIPCISTYERIGAGCYVLGEHRVDCRGVVLDGGRLTACTGCLPQPATHGLVCESCWSRYRAALDVAVDHITHMRSIERGPMPVGPKVQTGRPGSKVIVPVSWLDADEAWTALCDVARWVDPLGFLETQAGGTTAYGFGSRDSIEHVRDRVALAVDLLRLADLDVVRRDRSAKLAIRFYRLMQALMFRYPTEEHAHTVAYATCRECGNRTLERRPPLRYEDPITVRCIHPGCGAVFHPALVDYDLATYRQQLETELTSSGGVS
ncbi:hypothetical protein [Microbacterium caowuchunii]|uniref:Uncharacterized protein n=1 Tax=Microbacterium caowuchunii TaxID=2614638 RepID=A0A5N0TK85_9MICO|nr:hypothetical protein [Microbacterium caowuchunii]KAA9133739.1 hypothetical protein F6B40_08275 [Microbacterium caowuchunii]